MRIFAALSVVFSLFLTACSGGGSSQKHTLTIWESYNDEEHAVFQQIVSRYEARHPGVKIEVQRVPFQGMEQKVLTALAAGMPPDLARVDYAFVATLAAKHAAVPLLPEDLGTLAAELLQAPLESNRIHDTLYGLPDQTTCILLFYNRDLFQRFGVQAPPKTWDEFVTLGKKLTHPDQGIYAFGMRNSLWWTFPFFFSFGARFLSPDRSRCELDSPEGIQAFTFKVDLYRRHRIEAGAWKPGAVSPDVGFVNGKYAMILSGPWAIKQFQQMNLNFGIAPVPAGPAGSRTTIGGTNMVILNPKKKTEALKFLKFLLSPEIQAFWANELGQVPVNRRAFARVDTLKHPFLPVIMRAMDTAIPRPPLANYGAIELAANAEMDLALQGKKSPAQALHDAVRRINELLRETP